MTEPKRLDGNAIYGQLKYINESATSTPDVDQELQTLIERIKEGEFDCPYKSRRELTDIERIYYNNLQLLLSNSMAFTLDMQHALLFALECIEELLGERG